MKMKIAFIGIMLSLAVLLPTMAAFAQIDASLLNSAQLLQPTITAEKAATNAVPAVPVNDLGQNAKDNGISVFGINIGVSWNQLALDVSRIVMNRVIDATVNWMNSGFEGSPAYVSDTKSFLANAANDAVGSELNKLSNGNLCSPFKAQLILAIRRANFTTYSPSCTLSQIGANLNNFYHSFDGGWKTWFKVTQEDSNNPYDVYFNTQNTLLSEANTAVNNALTTINWGQGFKSQTSCKKYNPDFAALTVWWQSHMTDTYPPGYDQTKAPGACIEMGDIQTPGSVIKSHLDHALPANTFIDQLVNADQYDKLLSALLNGLTQRFVFGQHGLLGKSYGNSSSPGASTAQNLAVSCSADTDHAVMNQDKVTWTAFANAPGNSTTDFSWSGDDNLTGTSSTVTLVYSTRGTKTAVVSATTTLLDDLGNPIPGSQKFLRATCSSSVRVSPYQPLSVSCSPNVGVSKLEQPVVWTALITGGSSSFSVLKWDGSQAHAPGCSNDDSRIYPQDNTADPHVIWKYAIKHTQGVLNRTDCSDKSETTWEDNGLNANKVFTSVLTRKYIGAEDHLGTMTANITVIDNDPDVLPVTAQCTSGVFIND